MSQVFVQKQNMYCLLTSTNHFVNLSCQHLKFCIQERNKAVPSGVEKFAPYMWSGGWKEKITLK